MISTAPRRCIVSVALISLISLGGSGCGSNSDIADVSGVVMLDGKPMPEAIVAFSPDSYKGTHGLSSSGTTDEEGRFRLMCYDKRNGAVIGNHRVVIEDMRSLPQAVSDATPVRPPPPKSSRIMPIYSSVATTPLRQEVKPGPQNITLEVKGKSHK